MAKASRRTKDRAVASNGRIGLFVALATACLLVGFMVVKHSAQLKDAVATIIPKSKSAVAVTSSATAAKPVVAQKTETQPVERPAVTANARVKLTKLIKNAAPPPASEPAAPEAAGESSPLSITLLNDDPTDDSQSRRDKSTLSVAIANASGKPIRAFEGILSFSDHLDKKIYSSKVAVSALMSEGTSLRWDERLNPKRLGGDGKRRLAEERETLKASFHVKKIFFVDGSVKTYDL